MRHKSSSDNSIDTDSIEDSIVLMLKMKKNHVKKNPVQAKPLNNIKAFSEI